MTNSTEEPSEVSLLTTLEQNCLHARHVESIRLWFTNIYVIVAATILGLIGTSRTEQLSLLTIFLLIFSIAGIVVTYNSTAAFKNHVKKARLVAEKLGVRDYLALGVLFEKRGKWRYLMHPWEFYTLFALVIGICVYILVTL